MGSGKPEASRRCVSCLASTLWSQPARSESCFDDVQFPVMNSIGKRPIEVQLLGEDEAHKRGTELHEERPGFVVREVRVVILQQEGQTYRAGVCQPLFYLIDV